MLDRFILTTGGDFECGIWDRTRQRVVFSGTPAQCATAVVQYNLADQREQAILRDGLTAMERKYNTQ